MLVLVAASCARDPSRRNSPLDQPPIEAKLRVSADAALAWPYRKTTSGDLDGDGSSESVVLAADVSFSSRGVPLWEDGHRWAVVVEGRRTRTLVYAAFVPNGFVEAALLEPGSDGRRQVLVQQRSSRELRAFTIAYEGPGQARSASAAYYQVESWLPGAATLPP